MRIGLLTTMFPVYTQRAGPAHVPCQGKVNSSGCPGYFPGHFNAGGAKFALV